MKDWSVVVDAGSLEEVVERAHRRRAGITIVEGAYGAGTTTLVAAAVDALRARGTAVLVAPASPELRDIPLGALAPLLATEDLPPTAPSAERLQRLFVSLAPASAAPVLVIDDATHLDEISAAAVRQLVHTYGVRGVVTVRTGAALPEPLARLEDEGLAYRLRIPSLRSTTVAELVEGAVGERIEPESLKRLVERAAGNPRLVRGLVDAADAVGGVRPSPGGIVIDAVPLPARLRGGILADYAALPAACLPLAEALAVAGRVPVDALDRDALAALIAAGLVAVVDGVAAIAHPLHIETLTAGLDPERMDLLRLSAAEIAALAGGEEERFAATVLLAGSSSPPATEDVVWAAERANALEDRAVAIELAERAVRLADARDEPSPARALLVWADALSVSGRLEEADQVFLECVARATTDFELAAAAVRSGFHFAFRRDRADRAAAIWDDALERLTEPGSRDYLTTNIGKWQVMIGVRPALEPVAEAAADNPALALNPRLLQLLSSLYAGDVQTAREAIATARPYAEAARDVVRHGVDILDFGQFVVLLLEARVDEALAFADAAQGDPFDEPAGMWGYGRAFAHYHAGRLDEAARLVGPAVEQLAWRDILGLLGAAVGLQASIAARLGDLPAARRIAGALDADARRYVLVDLQVAEAEAWMLAADGDEQAAIERLTTAVRAANTAGHWCFAAITASIAVRLGHPAIALETRDASGESPVAPLAELLVAHARALAASDPSALLAAAEALESAGVFASAHDAARQAAELARLGASAAVTRRIGKVRSRTAALLSPAPVPDGLAAILSPRELAIARLAADRHRNREIAERLGLSLRTVENHLANTYRKLGVDGRDGLRDALRG